MRMKDRVRWVAIKIRRANGTPLDIRIELLKLTWKILQHSPNYTMRLVLIPLEPACQPCMLAL